MSLTEERLPTYFISHGGGPWPWMDELPPEMMAKLKVSLEDIPRELGVTPSAVLVVSGHWEETDFTVQTHPNPPMYYDYDVPGHEYTWPEKTFQVQYPSPGSLDLANRVAELLQTAALPTCFDDQRGYDHGMFVPMAVAYPDAEIPALQLSIKKGYDAATHLAAGRALAPLRDEGVLILGSGYSWHNIGLDGFGPPYEQASKAFDEWLFETLVEEPHGERTRRLIKWEDAPNARDAHPTEDHLIPLMVAVGAAEDEDAVRTYHEEDFGFTKSIASSSYRFGPTPGR